MRAIALALSAFMCLAAEVEGGKLYVILAGDTTSRDVAKHVASNMFWLELCLFNNIPQRQIHITRIAGKNLTWQRIRSAVGNLPIGGDDALLFYYCGHGFWHPTRGRFVRLSNDRNNRVYFTSILKLLTAKRARLTVLINDSCSVEATGPIAYPGAAPPTAPETITPNFKSLFFKTKGVIQMDSSSPGEYALCVKPFRDDGKIVVTRGSLFTGELIGRLHDPRIGSWRKLHEAVKDNVAKWFVALKADEVVRLGREVLNQKSQTVRTLID